MDRSGPTWTLSTRIGLQVGGCNQEELLGQSQGLREAPKAYRPPNPPGCQVMSSNS